VTPRRSELRVPPVGVKETRIVVRSLPRRRSAALPSRDGLTFTRSRPLCVARLLPRATVIAFVLAARRERGTLARASMATPPAPGTSVTIGGRQGGRHLPQKAQNPPGERRVLQ
jgi:hypothetical protein